MQEIGVRDLGFAGVLDPVGVSLPLALAEARAPGGAAGLLRVVDEVPGVLVPRRHAEDVAGEELRVVVVTAQVALDGADHGLPHLLLLLAHPLGLFVLDAAVGVVEGRLFLRTAGLISTGRHDLHHGRDLLLEIAEVGLVRVELDDQAGLIQLAVSLLEVVSHERLIGAQVVVTSLRHLSLTDQLALVDHPLGDLGGGVQLMSLERTHLAQHVDGALVRRSRLQRLQDRALSLVELAVVDVTLSGGQVGLHQQVGALLGQRLLFLQPLELLLLTARLDSASSRGCFCRI